MAKSSVPQRSSFPKLEVDGGNEQSWCPSPPWQHLGRSSSSHPSWVSSEASGSDHSSTPLVPKAKTTYYLVQLEVSRPVFTLSYASTW